MKCPEHHIDLVKREGVYGIFWGCPKFPACKVTATIHPNGTIKGTPAGTKTKKERVIAHHYCNKIWGDWDKIGSKKKKDMYNWLAKNTSTGHIGLMTYRELKRLNKLLRKLIKGELR